MAASGQFVCSEVARKVEVEVEEKCGSGVNAVGTVDCNVGGTAKDGYGGSIVEVVQFKKEELGVEKEGVAVDPLVSVNGGNGDLTSVLVKGSVNVDGEVEVDRFKKEGLDVEKEGMVVDPLVCDVGLENGSTVDSPVVLVTNGIAQDVRGHVEKVSGEQEADVKGEKEADGAKVDDTGFGLAESTLNAVEGYQVTDFEFESAIKPSDVMVTDSLSSADVINGTDESLSASFTVSNVDNGVMVSDGPESVINLVDKACEVTVDVSGKPCEDLGSQVTVDEPKSSGGPIKKECKVSVDGSDSIDGLVDNQECPVSVESEPSAKHTEKVESDPIVVELDGKPEEHEELLVVPSEVNVELEPNPICSVIKAEIKKAEGTEIQSGIESEESPDSGLVFPEEADAPANGQVENFVRICGTQANGSSEQLLKVTESVEIEEMKDQVKVEDEIQELQTAVVDNVQDELNLEDNTAESANEAEVSLEVETNIEKDDGSLSHPDDLVAIEQDSHLITENGSAEGADCGTGIENVDVSDVDEKETKVKDAEDVPHPVTEIESLEAMDCETRGENVVVSDDEQKESEVNDASVGDQSTLTFSGTIVNHGAAIKFGSFGCHEATPSMQNEEVEDMNGVQGDEISNSSDAIDVQNEEVEVLEYNFLVRIPRFEDDNLRDQIRIAQELVEDKTRIRDSIRVKVIEKRDMMKAYNDEYDLVKKDEIAARRVVKAKRQEIEAVQALISRWKSAMTVQDIDTKIFGVEYHIQHETICLVDEKEFIRELKKLKSLRDELASNMGTAEEIRHAIDTIDHNEERMKTLRKELEPLKHEVYKFEPVLEKIAIKYEEANSAERDLQRQFRAADAVRQKAYAHLNDLKKLAYDKNENFRQFKEDFATARNFLSQGDKDALHRLCANQVETFMEQWNNNDEFRQEYVSRKQKAPDGAPLVPDDVVHVLPSNMDEKVDRSPVSVPGEIKQMSVVLPVESKDKDNHDTSKSIQKILCQKNQEMKNKGVAKPTDLGNGDVAKEAELAMVAELEETIPTKEEIELAREAEELRNEEIAAKLKEQRRVEEKAKAIEALERKKRNAEKAQLRAELRARKEAEQKEKEREKRLRKKEKKTGDGCINGEEVAGFEGSNEATTKEIETVTNKKKSQKPPAHFFSKQLKPKAAPSPLINKNKKRWQQLKRVALAILGVLGVLLLFVLANLGLFVADLKPAKFATAF